MSTSLSPTQIQAALDQKTKPPGSLGLLEELAARLASIQQTLKPAVTRKLICVFAADHGVAEEGVSAYPQAVTVQMVANFLRGGAAISVLSRTNGIDLHVVDAGVNAALEGPGFESVRLFRRAVLRGTRNFTREPAMTREECAQTLGEGRQHARLAQRLGYQLVGIGEMGIANTTAATAVICALLGFAPEEIAGRGTGVDDTGLSRKIAAIKKGLDRHRPICTSPEEWLASVGGLEIAAMTGFLLECAELRLPVVVDGFITTAAAVTAIALNPAVAEVCFFSHQSAEKGHILVLEKLGVQPILSFGLRLGEGTGAALAMPILDGAARILSEMATFADAGVSNALPSDESAAA